MISEKLLAIQTELKAPKGQRNTFGNYNYRSCEDILEAVKPLLKKHSCTLTISDELMQFESRYYIRATVTLIDKTETISVSGYARETESRKGMDASQITGASSSYARKYALNGLFLIDDTKDADVTNKHGKDEVVKKPQESIMQQIKGCKTVEGLKDLWGGLSETDQPLYLDKITTCKAILQANEHSKTN